MWKGRTWNILCRSRAKQLKFGIFQQKDGSDSTSETDERTERKNRGYMSLAFGPDPAPEKTAVDDEYLLMREVCDDSAGQWELCSCQPFYCRKI